MASQLITPSLSQTFETLLPQMAVINEPDTSDTGNIPIASNEDNVDSNGSDVEILDSGSDVDICEETELTKFSRILRDAQKQALAVERAKGKKRKSYTGHSRATGYRRKRVQRDLAAQGYLPLGEVWKQMALKKIAEESTAPQELASAESEEDSDIDAALARLIVPKSRHSKDRRHIVQGPAVRDKHRQLMQTPVANKEHHRDVLDPGARGERHRNALGPVARVERGQDVPGPDATDRCHRVMQHLVASEEYRRATQGLLEEEEESTESESEVKGTARGDSQNVVSGTHMHSELRISSARF